MLDPGIVRSQFENFSRLEKHDVIPLYAYLSKRIAENSFVVSLASKTKTGQPAPNMLFGAVHFLLLSGADHPLGAYYASISPEVREHDASTWPSFHEFCRNYEYQISNLIETRNTQTNEVGRSALLLPAFAVAASSFTTAPLHMIEVGASAGLNLNWPYYGYDYGFKKLSPLEESTGLTIKIELKGALHPRLPEVSSLAKRVAMRSGIEPHPVRLDDDDSVLWLKALVWPDHVDRMVNLEKAVRIARRFPPRIYPGSATKVLPHLVEATPPDMVPLIYHTFVRYLFDEQTNLRFEEILQKTARKRDFGLISIEWIDQETPTIDFTWYTPGSANRLNLAACNPHGKWLEWLLKKF